MQIDILEMDFKSNEACYAHRYLVRAGGQLYTISAERYLPNFIDDPELARLIAAFDAVGLNGRIELSKATKELGFPDVETTIRYSAICPAYLALLRGAAYYADESWVLWSPFMRITRYSKVHRLIEVAEKELQDELDDVRHDVIEQINFLRPLRSTRMHQVTLK